MSKNEWINKLVINSVYGTSKPPDDEPGVVTGGGRPVTSVRSSISNDNLSRGRIGINVPLLPDKHPARTINSVTKTNPFRLDIYFWFRWLALD